MRGSPEVCESIADLLRVAERDKSSTMALMSGVTRGPALAADSRGTPTPAVGIRADARLRAFAAAELLRKTAAPGKPTVMGDYLGKQCEIGGVFERFRSGLGRLLGATHRTTVCRQSSAACPSPCKITADIARSDMTVEQTDNLGFKCLLKYVQYILTCVTKYTASEQRELGILTARRNRRARPKHQRDVLAREADYMVLRLRVLAALEHALALTAPGSSLPSVDTKGAAQSYLYASTGDVDSGLTTHEPSASISVADAEALCGASDGGDDDDDDVGPDASDAAETTPPAEQQRRATRFHEVTESFQATRRRVRESRVCDLGAQLRVKNRDAHEREFLSLATGRPLNPELLAQSLTSKTRADEYVREEYIENQDRVKRPNEHSRFAKLLPHRGDVEAQRRFELSRASCCDRETLLNTKQRGTEHFATVQYMSSELVRWHGLLSDDGAAVVGLPPRDDIAKIKDRQRLATLLANVRKVHIDRASFEEEFEYPTSMAEIEEWNALRRCVVIRERRRPTTGRYLEFRWFLRVVEAVSGEDDRDSNAHVLSMALLRTL